MTTGVMAVICTNNSNNNNNNNKIRSLKSTLVMMMNDVMKHLKREITTAVKCP
jgi:hypothetical protein